VPLAIEPVEIEGLGLSLRPPATAVVARERSQESVNLVLAERAEDPRWRVRIQSLDADASTPTSRMIVQDHLNRLNASGRPFQILAFEPATWGGATGDLLVVEELGPDAPPVVNGWLVLPRGGLLFTVVTLSTTREYAAAARAALESSLSTLRFTDLGAVSAKRLSQLEAGDEFIKTLTPERLRELVGLDQWFRLHQPGRDGADREVGYVQFRVVEALRGELDPARKPEGLRGIETEKGLMLVARARGLLNDDGSNLLDIEARYWMSWDRSSEAWSSRTTERVGASVRGYAQTGVRQPSLRGRPAVLTVITKRSEVGRDGSNPSQTWDVPSKGYLCVPESLLLGWLLPRDGSEPKDFAFVAFDTKEGRLSLRLDRWAPGGEGGAGAAPGAAWTLTSQPAPDAPRSTQTFDARGQRVRSVDADGAISDRIELAELHRIWKSKRLPTG
jgi:hypothetical protein